MKRMMAILVFIALLWTGCYQTDNPSKKSTDKVGSEPVKIEPGTGNRGNAGADSRVDIPHKAKISKWPEQASEWLRSNKGIETTKKNGYMESNDITVEQYLQFLNTKHKKASVPEYQNSIPYFIPTPQTIYFDMATQSWVTRLPQDKMSMLTQKGAEAYLDWLKEEMERSLAQKVRLMVNYQFPEGLTNISEQYVNFRSGFTVVVKEN